MHRLQQQVSLQRRVKANAEEWFEGWGGLIFISNELGLRCRWQVARSGFMHTGPGYAVRGRGMDWMDVLMA